MADIKLKDFSGKTETYNNVTKIWLEAADSTEEKRIFLPFSYGEVTVDNNINDLIDQINGEIISGVVVTFVGVDLSVLYQITVAPGYDCPDPVLKGLISEPQKEPTNMLVYSFSGWSLSEGGDADSNALRNVTEDRTVYAAFSQSTRYYTIRFYVDGILSQSIRAKYGDTLSPDIPTSSEYVFDRWEPALEPVTKDMSYHAVWSEKLSFATASWESIATVCANGTANQNFAVGDTKTVSVGYEDGTAETITVEIVDFNYDDLADGTGKAGISIMSVGVLAIEMFPNNTKKVFNGIEAGNAGGWSNSDIKTYCNGSLFNALPVDLQKVIKPVVKLSDYGYADPNSDSMVETIDRVWLASKDEVWEYGTRYKKFARDSDRIKYYKKTEKLWYLRNTGLTTANSWAMINKSGGYNTSAEATETMLSPYRERPRIAFGFCI